MYLCIKHLLQRGAFVSEPAILVKRINSGSQIWSMEKLENKLIDMREMYQEHKERILNGLVSLTYLLCLIFNMETMILGVYHESKEIKICPYV